MAKKKRVSAHAVDAGELPDESPTADPAELFEESESGDSHPPEVELQTVFRSTCVVCLNAGIKEHTMEHGDAAKHAETFHAHVQSHEASETKDKDK